MSFCFLYNVVSENYSVQNSPWGGRGVYCQLKVYVVAFSITIYSTINTPQKEMLQLQKEDDKFISAKFRIC